MQLKIKSILNKQVTTEKLIFKHKFVTEVTICQLARKIQEAWKKRFALFHEISHAFDLNANLVATDSIDSL